VPSAPEPESGLTPQTPGRRQIEAACAFEGILLQSCLRGEASSTESESGSRALRVVGAHRAEPFDRLLSEAPCKPHDRLEIGLRDKQSITDLAVASTGAGGRHGRIRSSRNELGYRLRSLGMFSFALSRRCCALVQRRGTAVWSIVDSVA
jgi:hypothetical protein